MEYQKLKTMVEDGVKYETYLTPETREVVSEIALQATLSMENGNKEAQDIVNTLREAELEREALVKKEEMEYRKILRREENEERRAGYIHASILLYFIFIFGILIATTLLIFKN